MIYEINPLILEKLESLKEADENLKAFIREILALEKQKMNLQEYRYKVDYENIINRYIESRSGNK
jgi:hypothetical protein